MAVAAAAAAEPYTWACWLCARACCRWLRCHLDENQQANVGTLPAAPSVLLAAPGATLLVLAAFAFPTDDVTRL